jgi:WhiB family redox-sensing transcriptional regulator
MTAPAELLDFPPTLRRIRDEGACRDAADPDEFFPTRRELGGHMVVIFCRLCPVRADCLQWALDHGEEGVWGGMTERQRRKLMGRPA